MKKFWIWLKEDAANIVIVIMLVFAIVFAGIVATTLFSVVDFKAATTADYDYLYEHLPMLEEHGLEAYHSLDDVQITLSKDYLKLESVQCILFLEMDNNHNFSEISRHDKARLGGEIIVVIVSTLFVSFLFGFFAFFVEVLILCFGDWCLRKILLLRRKRES